MKYITWVIALFTLCALVARAEPERPAGETWPQWRGPTRDGQFHGPTWPDKLNTDGFRQLWRVEMGPSYCGPIVALDRVFTAETRDGEDELVTALDRSTGKTLWQARWKGSMSVPFFAAGNGSWIRATPAYDGQSLYVAGMRDLLVCLDGQSGKERWRVDFTERFKTPLPAFGFVSSPLVVGDHVYVQAGASFVKLDKNTGETVWRTLQDDGGMAGSAFASPVVATIDGVEQLLVQSRTQLAGIDPGSGNLLWSQPIEAFRGMNILTPIVHEGRIYTSAYGGASQLFSLTRQGDAFKPVPVWTNRQQGYMTTPVVVNGHAYLLLRNQRVTCVDLTTGDIRWTTEKGYGKYWSMIAQGDRILALDQRGILYLLKANPEQFELIDERKIADQDTWAHLAVAGRQLFVRERNALTAFEWKP